MTWHLGLHVQTSAPPVDPESHEAHIQESGPVALAPRLGESTYPPTMSELQSRSASAPSGPETAFASPWGELTLSRWPRRPKEKLRAWDAADEHLLRVHAESGNAAPGLVVNDAFGSLTASLLRSDPAAQLTVATDSVLSTRGVIANLDQNQLSADRVTIAGRVSESAAPSGDLYRRVFMKVPKSNGLLEAQLHQLRLMLAPGAVVEAGVMARHLQRSTLDLFSSILGDAEASRAWRKSRVITAVFDPHLRVPVNPWPRRWSAETPDGLIEVVNEAGVFSSGRLDIGTRFLLQHLPEPQANAGPQRAVDLGCGNGVVGEAMRRRLSAGPGGEVLLVDESHAAVASARMTLDANAGVGAAGNAATVNTQVVAAASLDDIVETASVDIVVNNPPFHDDRAMGDAAAWEMFQSAYRALAPGGGLRVVGNQHLRYHLKLQRIFGNVEVVASNPKFVVLQARR